MRVVAIFRVFAKMAQTFRHLLYIQGRGAALILRIAI
jgi:hypothetical protein